MKKDFSVFIILIAWLCFSESSAAPLDNTLANRIDRFLQKSVENGFSGSVLVARNGEIVLSEGYGWAQREDKIPADSSTVYNIGSVTKQFTAAAVLKLVDQGKLRTSDTIATIFPNVPADKVGITIHQLLTHSAGISSTTGGFRYEYIDREQFLREFFAAPLASNPGVRHEYANAGYILLAAIIEFVSGDDYEKFLYEELFEPAGMKDTGYTRPNWSESRLAHGYYFSLPDADWMDWGTTPDQWSDGYVTWYGIGKGDLQSNVEDLYRWHKVLSSNKVLPKHLSELLGTPFIAESPEGTSYYGYGWAISASERNTKIAHHDGSNGIFFADVIRYVDEDAEVIFLSNVALGTGSTDAAWKIGEAIFDPEYRLDRMPKNAFALVYEFMKSREYDQANELPQFMLRNHGREISDERLLNQIGYNLLGTGHCDWAVALFEGNATLFPTNGNVFDSLGEAYMLCGKNDLAKRSFNRALELAPPDNCIWCTNSTQNLQKLDGGRQ